MNPVEERSKELWHNAERQLTNGDTTGAKTSYQQIIILNHPDWAPHARAALGRLEPPIPLPPPTPEPPDEVQVAQTVPDSASIRTLLDAGLDGAKEADTATPTTGKGYITAPKVGKFRRGVALVIDILPILLLYAAGLTIAYATRESDTSSYTSSYCNSYYTSDCTSYSTYHYISDQGRTGMLIATLAVLLYELWNWLYRQGKKGATIGKTALRFKVLRAATEKPPGFGFIRFVSIVAPTVFMAPLAYVWLYEIAREIIR